MLDQVCIIQIGEKLEKFFGKIYVNLYCKVDSIGNVFVFFNILFLIFNIVFEIINICRMKNLEFERWRFFRS